MGFYVHVARESGGPVLEVGCGTGRVLIPTTGAGVDVAGVDASPRMLEIPLRLKVFDTLLVLVENAGRLVTVTLTSGDKIKGRIGAAADQSVELEADGERRTIRYDDVARAKVEVEFNRKPEREG